MRKLKIHGLYKIVWQDAWSSDIPWQDEESVKCLAMTAVNYSVGFLVCENAKSIILAQSLCPIENKYNTICGIPRGCIIKIIKLGET